MSEVKHYTGSLIRLGVMDSEEEYEMFLKERGVKWEDYYESWEEVFKDYAYDRDLVVIAGVLYAVHKRKAEEDIYESTKTPEGYDFRIRYYNGCESWADAIVQAVTGGNNEEV